MPLNRNSIALLMALATAPVFAQSTIDFGPASNVSQTPSGTARSDYVLVVDQSSWEKLHVVTYADGPNGQRDVYVRYSYDGVDWSAAMNLSDTAGQSNGFGGFGNSRRPVIVADGDEVLVVWNDRYCPGGSQGSYSQEGDSIGFACIWVARSTDAGRSWSAAEQLTDGSRDAINQFPASGPVGFAVAWQEDPAGVPQGGTEGASGASGNPGTDVHYTALSKADFVSGVAFPPAVEVSDNVSNASGQPRATRPNLQLADSTALLAYEETKSGAQGKNVIWHDFPYLAPPTGSAGSIVNQALDENARRVRIVAQSPAEAGAEGATVMVLWRQGVGTQDAPADFMMRRASGGYGIGDFTDAVNLSGATLAEATDFNPQDSIRGHRGILQGAFAAVVFIYTPSEAERTLQLVNYDVITRRSHDGGQTWSVPQNVSRVSDLSRTAFAPRIVATPETIPSGDPLDVRDENVYFLAWDTRQNLPQVDENAERYDAFAAITTNRGAVFSPPVPIADSASREWETGLQAWPSGEVVCAIWKQRDPEESSETWFRCGQRGLLPALAVPVLGPWSLLLLLAVMLLAARGSARMRLRR